MWTVQVICFEDLQFGDYGHFIISIIDLSRRLAGFVWLIVVDLPKAEPVRDAQTVMQLSGANWNVVLLISNSCYNVQNKSAH